MLVLILVVGVVTIRSATGELNCQTLKCKHYTKCSLINGTATCTCSFNCSTTFMPICGSNGKTYINKCELKYDSCKEQKEIALAHSGTCLHGDQCKSTKCDHNKICKVINGTERCICPTSCGSEIKPVCSGNNKTYQNECFRKLVACHSGLHVDLAHTGICDDCKMCQKSKKFCYYHPNNGSMFCSRCNLNCPSNWDPKCASNGQLYDNLCFLNAANCKDGLSLKIKYNGTCSEMRRNELIELGVGISLGVLAICGVIVFAVLMYFFRFRIPKRAKRIEEQAFALEE